MSDTQRNFIILAIIVVVIMTFSQAQVATGLFAQLLNIAFVALLGLSLGQWYRRNEQSVQSLKVAPRLVLQLSLIGGFLVFLTGTVYPRWAQGPINTMVMFGLLALCLFGWYWSWQQRSSYW